MKYLIQNKTLWGGVDTIAVVLQVSGMPAAHPIHGDDSKGYQVEGSITLRGRGVHRAAIIELLGGKEVGEEVEVAGFDIFGASTP